MKERRLFVCEQCNTEYADRKKAKSCEDSHKTKFKIKNMRHVAINNNKTGFPVTVTLEAEDGSIKTYKL